jgi:hypothetical protein
LVSNTTVKSILSSHPVDQKSDGIGQIYGRWGQIYGRLGQIYDL